MSSAHWCGNNAWTEVGLPRRTACQCFEIESRLGTNSIPFDEILQLAGADFHSIVCTVFLSPEPTTILVQDTGCCFRAEPDGIASTAFPFASSFLCEPGKQAFHINAGPAAFVSVVLLNPSCRTEISLARIGACFSSAHLVFGVKRGNVLTVPSTYRASCSAFCGSASTSSIPINPVMIAPTTAQDTSGYSRRF